MNTIRPGSRQAYIQRVLKAQQPRAGVVFGAGRLIQESGGLGGDLIRHFFLVSGVAALVVIAVGATTDSAIYWTILNWISSLFVRG